MRIPAAERERKEPRDTGWRAMFAGIGRSAAIAVLLLTAAAGVGYTEGLVAVEAIRQSGSGILLGEYPRDKTELDIDTRRVGISDPVVDIVGLTEFADLRRLDFYITPQIRRYDFLSDLPNLQQLLISHARPESVEFLRDLTGLRVLVIQLSRTWGDGEQNLLWPEEPIDLSEHTQLEFLGLMVLSLSRFPRFTNVPESLKYVDLTYNDLEITRDDIPWLEELRSVDHIFLYQNDVDPELLEMFPNISMRGDPENVYPEYWLH